MVKWEYHQEGVPTTALLAVCNAAGAEGWELAAPPMPAMIQTPPVHTMNGGRLEVVNTGEQPAPGFVLLFKRPAGIVEHGKKNGHASAARIVTP